MNLLSVVIISFKISLIDIIYDKVNIKHFIMYMVHYQKINIFLLRIVFVSTKLKQYHKYSFLNSKH